MNYLRFFQVKIKICKFNKAQRTGKAKMNLEAHIGDYSDMAQSLDFEANK